MNNSTLLVIVAILALAFLAYVFYQSYPSTIRNTTRPTTIPENITSNSSAIVSFQRTVESNTSNYSQRWLPASWNYTFYLPPNFSMAKTYPLIIGLHGEGSSASGIISLWRNASADGNFIFAAPQSNINGWDIHVAQEMAIKVLADMRGNFSISEAFLTGCSAGAEAAYPVALWDPGVFTGTATIGGAFGSYVPSNSDLSNSLEQNFYIEQGGADNYTPIQNTQEQVGELQSHYAKVKLVIIPGLAHACTASEVQNASQWFVGLESSVPYHLHGWSNISINAQDNSDKQIRSWELFVDTYPGTYEGLGNYQASPTYEAQDLSNSTFRYSANLTGRHTIYFVITQSSGSALGTYSGNFFINDTATPFAGVNVTEALNVSIFNGVVTHSSIVVLPRKSGTF